MKKKTKILVFSCIPTHPQDMGCRRRVYNLLDEFQKQNCEIHIMYLPIGKKKDDEKSVQDMRNKWDEVCVLSGKKALTVSGIINSGINFVDWSFGSFGSFIRLHFPKQYKSIRKMNCTIQKITRVHVEFNSKDFDFCYEKNIFDEVREKALELKPDIFICEYSWYSFVLDAVEDNVLKLIDTHDSFTSFAKLHRNLIRLHHSVDITEDIEKFFLQRADMAIAIQDREKKFFEKLVGKGRAITIGHIVKIAKNKIGKNRNHLLFVGSDWSPNRDGIVWFMKEVWPILKKAKPNVKITIFGNATNYVEDEKDVRKINNSYNLDEEYAKSDVVICPIRIGSGLKIKAIESLGQGRPMVATKHVAEGFGEYNKGNKLFPATDSPEKFSEEIITLLEQNNLYGESQKKGWDFSEKYNGLQRERIKFIIDSAKKKSEKSAKPEKQKSKKSEKSEAK